MLKEHFGLNTMLLKLISLFFLTLKNNVATRKCKIRWLALGVCIIFLLNSAALEQKLDQGCLSDSDTAVCLTRTESSIC